MTTTVPAFTLSGVTAVPVQVEVDLLRRLPCVVIVGLPGGEVREVADRVRSAIASAGFEFPRMRVVINLAPADVRKIGVGFDLAIAVGILVASRQVPARAVEGRTFYGELSLEGTVRSVRGTVAVARAAGASGLQLCCAADSALMAAASGCYTIPLRNLDELRRWETTEPAVLAPLPGWAQAPSGFELSDGSVTVEEDCLDALRAAAILRRPVMLLGPAGCGKTALAARLGGLLPPLSVDERLEIATVHEAAGLMSDHTVPRDLRSDTGVVPRPFRAPHHTISAAGMVGSASLRPGEVSLAHHGVLFLDDVPEFSRHVLEILYGTRGTGEIRMYRASGQAVLPARAWVIGAANLCPCGAAGGACQCTLDMVDRYRERWMRAPLFSGALVVRVSRRHASLDSVQASLAQLAETDAAKE